MNEKLNLRPAVQMYHPDSPTLGWSQDILNAKGQLVARVYGFSQGQVERRAAAFVRQESRSTKTIKLGQRVQIENGFYAGKEGVVNGIGANGTLSVNIEEIYVIANVSLADVSAI